MSLPPAHPSSPGMIGIVLVGHGDLAHELLATVEHVLGPLVGVRAVRIDDADCRAVSAAAIATAVAAADQGRGVVVVVDLHGSTPANLCAGIDPAVRHYVVSGANVPLVLKLARSRHLPLAQAVQTAIAAGRKYIGVQCLDPKELSA